jgi:FkbM family methyltransferase
VLKAFLKKIIKRLPVNFTVNQRYDRQTKQVIRQVCKDDSNCIDVGCHKGEILDIMLAIAPKGHHFGFEPIPLLFEKLQKKYAGSNCSLFQFALGNRTGTSSFNYVISNPAYSGLLKRKYDRPGEKDTSIDVRLEMLDNVIPGRMKIDLIKIDVEGGELQVLEGGIKTVKRCKPVIIFEHGLGASEFYGSSPEKIFELMAECGLKVSLMENWLRSKHSFTLDEFRHQFNNCLNFVFIAYP